MSVLIKHMAMPKGCIYANDKDQTEYCPLLNHDDVPFCQYIENEPEIAIGIDERPVYCSLSDVPEPCQDAVSRKAAIEAIKEDKIDLTNPNMVAVFKATGDFEKAETQVMTCDRHIKILKDLPPAQPDNNRIWEALSKVYNMDVPDEAKTIIGDVMLGLDEPLAQPEIIHCRDCKWWRDSDHTCGEHSLVSPMLANDFCSRAERRQDEQND